MWAESGKEKEKEYSARGRDQYGNVSTPNNNADGFQLRGQSWHVATDIPSDLLVRIQDVSFHLHKYLLFCRSGKLTRLVYESKDDDDDDAAQSHAHAHAHAELMSNITMNDIPGGHEAFLLAAKFCYGINLDLSAANISGLRCAAEYLEMTEDYEEGNLIFKTEAFLSYVVLSSWNDSIIVLKSCENLSPWAENLQIVRRCSDSIAWKACTNPKVVRWAYTIGKSWSAISSVKYWANDDDDDDREVMIKDENHGDVPPDWWWFEDVSILRIDHFVKVITAIKVKGMRFELIGSSIMYYASKWLPGLINDKNREGEEEGQATEAAECRNGGFGSSSSYNWNGGLHMVVVKQKEEHSNSTHHNQAKEQRMIIESLISILPPQKNSVSCTFLLQLLKMANGLKLVSPALITELEKRVGMQFEQATLQDLLIPSYNSTETTMFDVDLVQRLLEHFLIQEVSESCSSIFISSPHSNQDNDGEKDDTFGIRGGQNNAKTRVARLVDSYLTEVARDRNLSLTKFQVLAEALPDSARSCDDGLYRAIDSYLKAHPTLSELERKRLCRLMDCQKLSVDARMHAAQNERLPLRVVMQVLFSEQMKINNAMMTISKNSVCCESSHSQQQKAAATLPPSPPPPPSLPPQSFQEGWSAAKKDINTLKFELETMKNNCSELQINIENLQRQFEKMMKQKQSASSWSSGWKKFSKFTKMNNVVLEENQDLNDQKTRKSNRRWRYSIS